MSRGKKNLVSVLTPTHNRGGKYLSELIESIALQSHEGFEYEHIIVDNNSTDNTRQLVQRYAKKDKRIKYIYNPRNIGAADALNIAFEKSQGDLIVPIDDDDLVPRFSLQFRFDFFKRNPKAKWAYGHTAYVDKNGKLWPELLEYRNSFKLKKNYVYTLMVRNFIPGGSVTIKRECIKKVGGWNPDLKTQDFDMSLKLAAAKYVPHKMDSYLYYYRLHPKQAHKQQIKGGVYSDERQYYLDLYGVTEEFLRKL